MCELLSSNFILNFYQAVFHTDYKFARTHMDIQTQTIFSFSGDRNIISHDAFLMEKRPLQDLQDSVHGSISLDSLYWDIIDTPQFKRLQNLKQLGMCY